MMDTKPRANNATGFWIETLAAADWRGISNIVDTHEEADVLLPQFVASADPGHECRINEAGQVA